MTNNQYGAKVYPYEATECKFLLGGIGTGNVSVGTRGNYCDWEIFGQPGKGIHFPYTFFALWAKSKILSPSSEFWNPGFSRRILALTGLFRLIWLGCPGLSVPVFRLLIPLSM